MLSQLGSLCFALDAYTAPLQAPSLEPINMCPIPTKIFQGREDILQQMQDYFGKIESEQKVFLLYGLGGIGKTQIALKFIEDNKTL